MISHKHKFIFVHIPKCAGTSIEYALFRYASDVVGTTWPSEHKVLRNKELFKFLKKYNDYFAFTFIRNPFERLLSTYMNFGLKKQMDFKNFVLKVKKFLSKDVEELYSNIPFNDTRLKFTDIKMGDVDMIGNKNYNPFGDNGNIGYHCLPQMYFMSESINFIGKQENLQVDFDEVCKKIGIPMIHLTDHRKTKHQHYTEYYDEETKQIVEEKYAKDIASLGYEFGD